MDKKEFAGKIYALYDKTNEVVALLNCLSHIGAESEITDEIDALFHTIGIAEKMAYAVLLDVEALGIEYKKGAGENDAL